jgi:hypothetical protein
MFGNAENAAEVLLRFLQALLLIAIIMMVLTHWRSAWMLYALAGIGIALLFVLGVTVGIKLAPSVRRPRQ